MTEQTVARDAVADAYARARQSALIVRHPTPELLALAGRDRLDLIHRMSTNDVARLEPGQIRRTVLTNAVGRIVDAVTLIAETERLLMLTSPRQGEGVHQWLQGYIFFQDEVELRSIMPDASLWGLYGPRAEEVLARAFPGLIPQAKDRVAEQAGSYAWRQPSPVSGIRLLLNSQDSERAAEAWQASGGRPVDRHAYGALRIEAGIPAPGSEITGEYIPLEVGLWDLVSFSKGCYIGQEIIARLESRGRLAKQLFGARLSGPAQAPAELHQGSKPVGVLTSAVHSPRLGWVGLAVAKPGAIEADGGRVIVQAQEVEAQLMPLPFPAP